MSRESKGLNLKFKKYLKYLWIVFGGGLALAVLFTIGVSLEIFGPLPTFEELENPKSNLASEVFSSDQEILGKFYIQNRSNSKYHELSPNLVKALVATEDERFEEHSGIDFFGLARVIVKSLILGQKQSGGGSTISQQLAKNLFPRERFDNPFTILTTKLKEWVTAVKIERNYTKKEIITLYFNTVDFGNNSFGIKSASLTYFNSTPDSLKIEEAAILVGLLKATSYYNPVRNPERATTRRNVVLNQMERAGYLSENETDSLKALPIELEFKMADHNEGLAPYFREYIRLELGKWCKENKKADGSSYDLYRDGLKIYTTINAQLQRYAEQSAQSNLERLQNDFNSHWKGRDPFRENPEVVELGMKRSERYRLHRLSGLSPDSIEKIFNIPIPMSIFTYQGAVDTVMTPLDSVRHHKLILRASFMAMEPKTGYVRAWVGGPDYRFFKYDLVKVGRRQVGSTFKPFVYTVAMDNGFQPCLEVPNQPVTFEDFDNWTPQNSDGKVGGMLTLKQGLAQSVNLVTAYLMKQIGPRSVVNMAKRMGVTSDIPAYPAICLGTPEVTLYDMVGAYSTFANNGFWTEPIYVTRIEDKNGVVLKQFYPKKVDAMSEETAYVMLNMLKGVTESGGTGVRIRGRKYQITTPVAGKTGTTQNNSDGWFIGITPDLVAGAWMGCEDRTVHFRSTALGQGANTALPIWADFMNSVYKDPNINISTEDFQKPKKPISIEFDCNQYKSKEKANVLDDLDF
ncbi:MAG: penicillin-binding protein 1A [Sphingobacteriales bacterium]|jgi:penicillin-binding protein 1A